jgi:hypothetical protein
MSPQDCRDPAEQCGLLAKFFELDDQLHETWREVATQWRRLTNNDDANYTASLDVGAHAVRSGQCGLFCC